MNDLQTLVQLVVESAKVVFKRSFGPVVWVGEPIWLTKQLPNKGIWSDVTGIASLILCWKTVNESRTVTPERAKFTHIVVLDVGFDFSSSRNEMFFSLFIYSGKNAWFENSLRSFENK
jgi:hypothetical protein